MADKYLMPDGKPGEPMTPVAQAAIAGSLWLHGRSGRIYRFLDYCTIEADCVPAVLYEGVESRVKWVRPLAEFMDGRFVRLTD